MFGFTFASIVSFTAHKTHQQQLPYIFLKRFLRFPQNLSTHMATSFVVMHFAEQDDYFHTYLMCFYFNLLPGLIHTQEHTPHIAFLLTLVVSCSFLSLLKGSKQ